MRGRRAALGWHVTVAGHREGGALQAQWEMSQWEMSQLRHERLEAGERLGGPSGLWMLVLDGCVEVETAAGREPLHAGDAALVGATTAHRVSAVGQPATIAVTDLRPAFTTRPLPSPFVVRGFADRHHAIATLVGICPLRGDCDRAAFAAAYGALIGAALAVEAGEQQGDAEDPAVAEVLAAVASSPGEPWTVARMSRIAHLSRSALVGHFRRSTGRSPTEMLRDIRMHVARRLLDDPARPVAQIAFAVGYGSTAAFSRAFSAHHGVGPQAWRAGARGRAPR